MQREIKFRAWDKESKFMAQVNVWDFKHKIKRLILMQYTGLKDMHDKEIYEGDILSSTDGTFNNTGMGIVREYKGMYVSFYGQDAIGRDQFDELHTVCNSREIIGNIHDNPELLQEVEK